MGQYSMYNLSVVDKTNINKVSKAENKIIEDLRSRYEDAKDAFDEGGNQQSEVTWESMEEDMKEFSKQYPDVVFMLVETGYSYDGQCDRYFLNGKMQECWGEIVFQPYNPELLK